MRIRKIGNLEVSAVGLGTMGFSHGYRPCIGDEDAVDLTRKAFDLGARSTTRPRATRPARTSDSSAGRWRRSATKS
jgi:hypothetical protein